MHAMVITPLAILTTDPSATPYNNKLSRLLCIAIVEFYVEKRSRFS